MMRQLYIARYDVGHPKPMSISMSLHTGSEMILARTSYSKVGMFNEGRSGDILRKRKEDKIGTHECKKVSPSK